MKLIFTEQCRKTSYLLVFFTLLTYFHSLYPYALHSKIKKKIEHTILILFPPLLPPPKKLRRLSVKFENLNELSDERILDSISDLVETERMILKSRAIHEKAELFLVDKPELFVNRVVQHFQYLFQVKKVEGVLPKMNELYLYTSEMENMIKVLKSLVGIEGTCSNTVLLATLQAAIERDEPVSISEKFKRHMAGGDEESDEN